MKLYTSPTSPYARLVRAVLLEKQLDSRVTPVWVNPWDSPEALLAVSPFSRVPVLEDEEGVCLTESAIIALYLERRFPEPRLMPLDRVEEVHRKLGLAQGLIDSAVGIVVHRRFRDGDDDDTLLRRRHDALARGISVLDGVVRPVVDRPDMGSLAVAVALEFLDFRLPDFDWRGMASELPSWLGVIASRPSLVATQPGIEQPSF